MLHFFLPLLIALLPAAALPESVNSMRLYTEEYPPFSYQTDDRAGGINVELLRQALENLGIEAEISIVPWGRAQLFTREQEDSCFFSAARTSDREPLYQWAGPLTEEHIVLYSLDNETPAESFADAADRIVGGQIADAYSDWVRAQGLVLDEVAEVPDNLEKLKRGRIDLWVAGSIAGPYIAEQEDMTLYPFITSDEVFELWLACNPDLPEDWLQALDAEIEALR